MMALPVPVTLFLAGLATSIGPCVAPRFLAAASFAANDADRRGMVRVSVLFCGIVCGYVALAAVSSSLASVARYSTIVYAVLACVFVVLGLRGLFFKPHECTHRHLERPSTGAAFLLGMSSVLVVSPCCAPVIGTIGVVALSKQSPAQTCILAVCFAVGHALPVLLAGWGLRCAGLLARITQAQHAVRVAGATLTLALGGYFAILV